MSGDVTYRPYRDENDLRQVQALFSAELSEPYQLWTYRYFVDPYPDLSFFAECNGEVIGCCMGSCLEEKKGRPLEGYIGMISVVDAYKRQGIGRALYTHLERRFRERGVEAITLETEEDNVVALRFYEKLGFRRTRSYAAFYMNGKNAFRLKRWLAPCGYV